MMRCERGFIAVLLFDFNLPISSICIACQEYSSLAKQVDAFVHSGDSIGISDSNSVQLLLLHMESERSIFLHGEHDR